MTTQSTQRTLVWDLPVRVFHWALVLSFAGAYLTAESERWRDLHVLLGYTAGALVVFRLLWGVVGTRYARFTSFLYRPSEVVAYLRSVLARRPRHYLGHNPAGALAIFALLALLVATVLSGWAALVEVGPRWMEDVHETAGNVALALVFVHIAGVIVSSWMHRENLVRSMVTGYKPGAAPAAAGPRVLVAIALLAVIGGLWIGYVPAPGLQSRNGIGLPTAVSQVNGGQGHERGRERERSRH
jgi:cytochrome b